MSYNKYQTQPSNTGCTVYVAEGKFELAMRKFKNKVKDAGILDELKSRESYVKPTTQRKENLAAAKKRDKRRIAKDDMPRKLY